jgi:hypothetical protein
VQNEGVATAEHKSMRGRHLERDHRYFSLEAAKGH